jgi:hypothetical protein
MPFSVIAIRKHTEDGTRLPCPIALPVFTRYRVEDAMHFMECLQLYLTTAPKRENFPKKSEYKKALKAYAKKHPIKKKGLRGEDYAFMAHAK